jgi:hypothetical protein
LPCQISTAGKFSKWGLAQAARTISAIAVAAGNLISAGAGMAGIEMGPSKLAIQSAAFVGNGYEFGRI